MFFFFKQKPAYEMRISYWSSDVCSSDLHLSPGVRAVRGHIADERAVRPSRRPPCDHRPACDCRAARGDCRRDARRRQAPPRARRRTQGRARSGARRGCAPADRAALRSEEHTSELQSLMRISYAVFCLKKKKTTPTANNNHQIMMIT